jgi:hypothetical protein
LMGGYTMGSYCGRVRQFLAASYVTFQQLPGPHPSPFPRGEGTKEQGVGSGMVVAQLMPMNGPHPNPLREVEGNGVRPLPPPSATSSAGAAVASSAENPFIRPPASNSRTGSPQPRVGTVAAGVPVSTPSIQPLQNSPVAQVSAAAATLPSDPPSRTEQIKTVLAVIGIIFILFHGLRLIGTAVG